MRREVFKRMHILHDSVMKYKPLILIAIIVFSFRLDALGETDISIEQSNVIIKGTVTDKASGEPLPGVNIFLKGTEKGITTNLEGNYSIEVPEGKNILVYSFVGYQKKEVRINDRTTINVQLQKKVEELDEVVVKGYGTQKKQDVTGAISKVESKDLEDQIVSTIDEGMQGMASGVQVSKSSGTPGGAARVLIRGTNSIYSGSEPLYIIDGVPVWQEPTGNTFEQSGSRNQGQNPLSNLNPEDIKSIDILKDASATAIYGSRGSNGVIIITTKKGKKGKADVSVNYKYGITTPVNMLKYANSRQYFEMIDSAHYNSKTSLAYDHKNDERLPVDYVPIAYENTTNPPEWSRLRAKYTDVNYRNKYLRNGGFHDLGVSITKGSEKFSTYVSFNMRDESGISTGNEFQRYNLRSNIDYSAKEWMKVGTRIGFSYIDNHRPINGNSVTTNVENRTNRGTIGGFWSANKKALPIFPVYNDEGEYFAPRSGRNIVASTDRNHIKDYLTQPRLTGMFYTELNPIEHLKIRGEASIDLVHTDQVFWLSGMLRTDQDEPAPMAYHNMRTNRVMNYIGYANYTNTFNDIHYVSLTAGVEATTGQKRINYSKGVNMTTTDKQLGEYQNNTGSLENVITVYSGTRDYQKRFSTFVRGNYKLMEKYLFEASFRNDASRKFEQEMWGQFIAFSGGWIISEENFFDVLNNINFLKIRLSYGTSGNDDIPSEIYNDLYATWPVYEGGAGYILSNLGNKEIDWEKSRQTDIGIDYGILNNKLSGSISYYTQIADGMILQTPVSYATGIATDNKTYINAGTMKNYGLEFNIKSVNIDQKGGLKWTTNFNISTSNNEIVELTGPLENNKLGITSGITSTRAGGKLGAFYLAKYAGTNEEGYEMIYEIDQKKAEKGIYEKTGNKILATQKNVKNHRMVHKDKTGLPTYYGGITNTLAYQGFEFSFQFYGQGGNYIYDGAEEDLSYVNSGKNNILRDVYKDWKSGDEDIPKVLWNNQQPVEDGGNAMGHETTRFLHKGDFIRLKNVTLGYNLPSSIINRMQVNKAKVYISVQNIFTITGYDGYDPEVLRMASQKKARNLQQGYLTSYNIPLVRTYSAGVKLNF